MLFRSGTAVTAGKVAGPGSASTTVTMHADYTVQANFAINQHTLTVSSTAGGSVTTPGEAGPYPYSYGESASIVAQADPNYHFVNWTGSAVTAGKVASPGSASTTVTMHGDYTIQANFAINQHALTVSSTAGGSVTAPGEAGPYPYSYGESASIVAQADPNYQFVNWTGSAVTAGKVADPNAASTTVTMHGDYTIQANFTIDRHTLTVSSTTGGSVTEPGETGPYQYDNGTTVPIEATADPDYRFVNWTGTAVTAGKVAGPNTASTTVTMDADYTIQANFAGEDKTPPSITNLNPEPNDIQVPLNNLITLHIVDSGEGIDANTVAIVVNSNTVYTGNMADYNSTTYGHCRRVGTIADYMFIYQANGTFDFDTAISVTVNATDLAGNAMDEYSYSFTTEMRSFGINKKVYSGSGSNPVQGGPATVRDSSGDIWATWHEGPSGARDIYVAALGLGQDSFGSSTRLTEDAADQGNPAMAADAGGKLYVVWQDNRRGNWDIYMSTSTDGISWSNEIRVTDSNDNQTNPVVAVDGSLPGNVYVIWQDDRGGNQDIYAAASSNNFVTATVWQITTDSSDQLEPAVAVDSENTVYVVWTDTRNGSNDIYGAASNDGPWANVVVVGNAYNQSSPAIAAEAAGSILHLLWVDDTSGDRDIFYAQTSGGLAGSPLVGNSIVDESTGADQSEPVIAVTGSTGDNLRVFACWQDGRYADTDLYFVDMHSSLGTNVFAGDNGTNADQSAPAMGIDAYGHPYLVWADNRNANPAIYYAGSTFAESSYMALKDVSISSGATVGADPASISSVDDVSVIVPAEAYLSNIRITISRVKNPQKLSVECLSCVYEFGPSGVEFTVPVTITIPYVPSPGKVVSAYWCNPLTGGISQTGITDVQTIVISPTLHALRFKTIHFTQFFVGGSGSVPGGSSGGGGGGGGGCSVSRSNDGTILEFLLPYVGLILAMIILKLRTTPNRKSGNITRAKC